MKKHLVRIRLAACMLALCMAVLLAGCGSALPPWMPSGQNDAAISFVGFTVSEGEGTQSTLDLEDGTRWQYTAEGGLSSSKPAHGMRSPTSLKGKDVPKLVSALNDWAKGQGVTEYFVTMMAAEAAALPTANAIGAYSLRQGKLLSPGEGGEAFACLIVQTKDGTGTVSLVP